MSHTKVHKTGIDACSEKALGNFQASCHHVVKARTGLTTIINTGHVRSIRADILGVYLPMDTAVEDSLLESVREDFPEVEIVTILSREAGVSLLFDLESFFFKDSKEFHKFACCVQKHAFELSKGFQKEELMESNRGAWGELHHAFIESYKAAYPSMEIPSSRITFFR